MKDRWRLASLIGVGCSSLCFLALPLLALLLPAKSLGWIHDETLTHTMLVMFLAMALWGSVRAFRHHRSLGPGGLAVAGAAGLAAAAWDLAPSAAGWPALAALTAAWIWDMRLLKRRAQAGNESCES
jgi:hypothetical protein